MKYFPDSKQQSLFGSEGASSEEPASTRQKQNMAEHESGRDFAADIPSVSAQERRRQYDAQRAQTRINIYEQFSSWRRIREELKFGTDKQLAEFFISGYLSRRNALPW